MNFYVWTKKKAPNLYQLGANDNEKETLIDCTSASAVFVYQIKSFVSILEDESARFFAVSKSNSNADGNRGKTGVFLGEFIVDKPVAINNIVEEIRKFAINKRNWTIKNNVLCCLRRNVCCHIFDRMPEKGQKASFVSRVGMTVLTVVLIVLFFFIMMLVSRIQGTARVVNYAGLVRGETQRIIKLEGVGLPQDGMIEDVASFAAFAARLNRSRFRPTRIFRSIMISAFRCPSRSMKGRSKNKLPPNAWQKRQHMLI